MEASELRLSRLSLSVRRVVPNEKAKNRPAAQSCPPAWPTWCRRMPSGLPIVFGNIAYTWRCKAGQGRVGNPTEGSDFLISRKLTGVGFAPASGMVQKQERAVNHPVIGFGSGQRV